MQQLGGAHHAGAKGIAHSLVAEANPEDGELPGERPYKRDADPGVFGASGTGRDQGPADAQGSHLVKLEGVIAPHDGLGPQLAEVLHQVVHERVVIVDDQDPGRHVGNASGAASLAPGHLQHRHFRHRHFRRRHYGAGSTARRSPILYTCPDVRKRPRGG